MSSLVIPLLIIIGFFTFQSKDESTSPKTFENANQEKVYLMSHRSLEEKAKLSINENQDYKKIYKFITQKYNKKDKEEAKLMTHYIVKFSQDNKLDPKLAAALIARESSFKKNAVSKTGAKGLGQIKDFNFKDLKINNPFNIKENINGTVTYLKKMKKKWDKKHEKLNQIRENNADKKKDDDIYWALASYYKGFTAVKKTNGYLDNQTRNYIKDIYNNYEEIKKID